MNPIALDSTIDLADRVSNVEKAIGEIVTAINAIPAPVAFDPSQLIAQLDAFKTELDAFGGRLDGDEKTIAAMGDALKTATPDVASELAASIDAIKAVVNSFHQEVFGPANPNVPFPPPGGSTN